MPEKHPSAIKASEQLDARLAAGALAKIKAGSTPTAAERNALKRIERKREEDDRRRYYASVPKKHYCELSGRQNKVVNEQARRYGIPCDGREVDLFAVLRVFHDLLAKHGHKLLGDTGDPLLEGASQALKDQYVREQIREKKEKAILARLERLEREQKLLPRDLVHELLGHVAEALRNGGQTMQRQHGEGPYTLLTEILEDAERTIAGFFDDHAPTADDDSGKSKPKQSSQRKRARSKRARPAPAK